MKNQACALTRQQWNGLWAEVKALQSLPLSEFANRSDACKRDWLRRYPQLDNADLSNARYVVHLNNALRRGLRIPPGALESVEPEEIRYDAYCLPDLVKALVASTPCTEDLDDADELRAA
jgi:hypothetical protein